jgi:uncharacterized protein (TIGR02265 family)
LDAYLAELPRGIDSYPQYLHKASIYRQTFSPSLSKALAPLLPLELGRLLLEPLPISAWLPEVHVNALFVAAHDALVPNEREFIERSLATARKLFNGPAYRVLLVMASPEDFVHRAQSRWVALHRGLELNAKMATDNSAVLRIGFPMHLLPRIAALTYIGGFQAALEAAGAKDVRCSLTSLGLEEALYEATWEAPRSSHRSGAR